MTLKWWKKVHIIKCIFSTLKTKNEFHMHDTPNNKKT